MRNPTGVRLIRIHGLGAGKSLQRYQYYCKFCWDTIIQRAKETYPQLAATAQSKHERASYAQQVGVLLGLRESSPTRGFNENVMLTTLDREYKLPGECVILGIPLAEYHPTGEDLKEHKKEAHRRLTPVGWE